MAFNIDLDRGVHSRSHPGNGMDIYMYVDSPGVYLSAHGTVIPELLAKEAGFPVENYSKQKRIKDALKAAKDKVLAELQASDSSGHIVVAEREGFQILDIGLDRFQVLAPDGDVINKHPLGKHEANVLLEQLVPEKD